MMTAKTKRLTSDALLAQMKLFHPKLIDLSLGRVERLLGKLGHPETQLPPAIHTAGTTGTGAITAHLNSIH